MSKENINRNPDAVFLGSRNPRDQRIRQKKSLVPTVAASQRLRRDVKRLTPQKQSITDCSSTPKRRQYASMGADQPSNEMQDDSSQNFLAIPQSVGQGHKAFMMPKGVLVTMVIAIIHQLARQNTQPMR